MERSVEEKYTVANELFRVQIHYDFDFDKVKILPISYGIVMIFPMEDAMILWTMQPIEIWKQIDSTGIYRCAPRLGSMPEPEFVEKYDWIIRQMRKRIGPPPDGVVSPVWAWYRQESRHGKPDLRVERWEYGPGDEVYTCIEFEIPDEQVLLSDFDAWNFILVNGLLANSEEAAN